VKGTRRCIKKHAGGRSPRTRGKQLQGARDAVFKSWNNPRAIYYRKQNKIADELGTAVNIQSMVFGNMGDDSATAWASPQPVHGQIVLRGVPDQRAGGRRRCRHPHAAGRSSIWERPSPGLQRTACDHSRLEKHYRDVQDFEFTIEKGGCSCFRPAPANDRRSGRQIAVDMSKKN